MLILCYVPVEIILYQNVKATSKLVTIHIDLKFVGFPYFIKDTNKPGKSNANVKLNIPNIVVSQIVIGNAILKQIGDKYTNMLSHF